ncbi:MAG: hypothetical protein GY737_04105 [Desulfobacteraceae bacterium]|nr:hypothetical protein [Desulfobacteraceae bacterium]
MIKKGFIATILISLFMAAPALAHTPLCSCWDEGDGTITCEGGFSDGSSAQGVVMYVNEKNGKTLFKGQMNEFSEFSFKKPSQSYTVIFDAGEGHKVEVNGEEIVE